ncbi:MAG: zinc ribbon domain-containing protein, partial [Clostridia bacterium]|nr:zinc ribbon domain-containing protein [Clostridia bacterium]
MAFCISCGKQIPDTVKFCPYCGSAVQVPQPIEEPPAEPKKKVGLFQNKPILFGCIGAGAALLLGILFCIYWFFLRPADRADAYTMYLQDDQLFMVNVADGDPILLGEAKNGDEAYRGLVAASDDHTVAYFPQDIDLQAKTFSLCFRHTKRAGETPIVLSRDVTRYTLIEGGMIPVYLTKDGTLNCHSLSINRKLADQVADFRAAKDGSYFYYISNDQKLYYIADYGSPMILDGGVTALCHLSEDGATIIYTKGSALYRRINCGNPELLSANCLSFVGVLANGDVVYLRAAEGDNSYYSFINDTNAVADAAFKEPQAPTPPNLEEIANETEYVAAQGVYNKALTDYQKA